MTEEQITIQNFVLLKRNIYYFKAHHIIGFDTWQHTLLKRNNLNNFSFIVAKGVGAQSINLKYARSEDANKLKSWYLRGKMMRDYNFMSPLKSDEVKCCAVLDTNSACTFNSI